MSPRFKRYREISGQVFEIFREFTDLVEGLSLDEAFLDVTASISLFGNGEAMAREIKKRIRDRTGLTASVGVSHNKLLAKLASEMQKPDGLTLIRPEDVTRNARSAPRRAPVRHRRKDCGASRAGRLFHARAAAARAGVSAVAALSSRGADITTTAPPASTSARSSPTRRRSRSAPRKPSISTSAITRNSASASRSSPTARRRGCARGSSRRGWSASRCGGATSRPTRGSAVSIRQRRKLGSSPRSRQICSTTGCGTAARGSAASRCRRQRPRAGTATRPVHEPRVRRFASASTPPWTGSTTALATKPSTVEATGSDPEGDFGLKGTFTFSG